MPEQHLLKPDQYLLDVEIRKELWRGVYVHNNASNPSYQVDIDSGVVGSEDGTDLLTVASTITVDITTSGAGGLDTGSEAADTWYYIWLIKHDTTEVVTGMFSASPTSPTMPTNYTMKRLIGAVRNDSTPDFMGFIQIDKRVHYYQGEPAQQLYTSVPSTSWVAVDPSGLVPVAISKELSIMVYAHSNSGASVYYHPGSPSGSTGGHLFLRIEDESEYSLMEALRPLGTDDMFSLRRTGTIGDFFRAICLGFTLDV